MKSKFVLLIILTLFFKLAGFSQKVYFAISGGYGWGYGALNSYESTGLSPGVSSGLYTMGNNTSSNNVTNINNVTNSLQNKSFSFSNGIQFDLLGGYLINSHIAFELGFGYISSTTVQFTTKYSVIDSASNYSSSSMNTTSLKGGIYVLTSGVKFILGNGKFRPYSFLGLTIGISPKVYQDISGIDGMGNNYHETDAYFGNTPFGITSKIGVSYFISKNLSFFSELNCLSMVWIPSNLDVTAYDVNNQSQLSSLPTSYLKYQFLNNSSYSSNQSSLLASQFAPISLSFNSIGAKIGVIYLF